MATSAHITASLLYERNPAVKTNAEGRQRRSRSYDPWGEATNSVRLHFQVESAMTELKLKNGKSPAGPPSHLTIQDLRFNIC